MSAAHVAERMLRIHPFLYGLGSARENLGPFATL
jgi:hypothetical protein